MSASDNLFKINLDTEEDDKKIKKKKTVIKLTELPDPDEDDKSKKGSDDDSSESMTFSEKKLIECDILQENIADLMLEKNEE